MAALIDLDVSLKSGEVRLDEGGGDENPLAPFSRGKFVWTTGETRVLAETMIKAFLNN